MSWLGRVNPRSGEKPRHPVTPSSSNFPYKALNFQNHEIRILVLPLTSVKDDEAIITGTLEHVSLIDTNPYTALSYCWGPPASKKSIRLRHQPGSSTLPYSRVGITDNLYRALDNLRARNLEEQEVRLWVDALCINQNDLYERSQQVQMMRQIYSRAKEVIAWVGPTVGKRLSDTTWSLLKKIDIRAILRNLQMGYEPTINAMSKTMIEFFNQEYWERVWIIQELTVASKVTVVYGDAEFSWDDLVSILRLLENDSLGASHLLKFRDHWIDVNKPIGLSQAMIWTLRTKATDPRDKIFALLGLCHDGFRLVPIPNYKQTVESVLSEMSRLSFSRSRHLDLICLRGATGTGPEEALRLPSWVPNWPNLWSSGKRTILENLILESPKAYQFDPVLPGSSDSVLKVEAIYFGTISGISTSLQMDTQLNDDYLSPKSWLFSKEILPGKSDGSVISPKSLPFFQQGIWSTLSMSSVGVTSNDMGVGKCFKSLWTPQGRGSIYNTRIIDWLDRNASFKIGGWTLREWSQYQAYPQDKVSASKSVWSPPSERDAQESRNLHKKVWDSANRSLEQVLGSGMRLAELSAGVNQQGTRAKVPALVTPGAELEDLVYFIKGCRFAVCLKFHSLVNQYKVRGGVWLSGELGVTLQDCQNWCEGRRTKPPDGARVSALELI